MHDHDFRQRYSPDETTLIRSCEIEVKIQPDHTRAKYKYKYDIKAVDGDTQREWFHIIPSAWDKVSFISAGDETGSLETVPEKLHDNKTKITIRYRKDLIVGADYSFNFSYEAKIVAFQFSQYFSRSIIITDSFYTINPCEKLLIEVLLPDGRELLESHPIQTPKSKTKYLYEGNNIRPLDDLTYLLLFKHRRLGKQFWIGVGFAALSAVLGVILSKLL